MWLSVLMIWLSGASGPIEVDFDTSFSLSVGESVMIADTGVELMFVRVIADSRCPQNVRCLRAGEAVVEIRLDEQVERLTLPESARPSTTEIGAYAVVFEWLEPYPQAGRESDDHAIKLRILRREDP